MKKIKKLFRFGEIKEGFSVPVLNEREMRAGAGIMLLLASFAFTNAFFVQNFTYIKIVIVVFLIDFAIRVLINPKFAPSLILGRLIVHRQMPEYVGAPQKRFAWALGLGLAIFMFIFMVILGKTGLPNLIVCLVCMTLLYLETAFGICLGCVLYNVFSKNKAQHCPGGTCKIS